MLDVKELRKQFPMLNGKTMQNKPLVFLDNAATTFKPQCVIDEITKYYTTMTSNSHRGDYDLCYAMDQEVAKARSKVAKFINSEVNEVIFTSGDTMGINLVAWGYGLKHLHKGDEVVISEAEHASNFIPWVKVCEYTGATIKFVPLSESGRITSENLRKVVNKNTKVISLAQVGNVLGYVANIKEFAKIAHEVGAIIVCDGAQSVPHMKVDFKDLDVDFLAFSAHKMCGPTGIGALIGKYNLLLDIDPILTGGGMNITFNTLCNVQPSLPPSKFEAGTEHLAGIMGFGKCIDFLTEIGIDNIQKHEKELITYAIEKLKKNENVIIYNEDTDTGIITFNLKNVFAQDEATLLNSKGIAVRSGLHCAKALVDYLKVSATVRMSVYLYTTKEEIDTIIDKINEGGEILDAYFSD